MSTQDQEKLVTLLRKVVEEERRGKAAQVLATAFAQKQIQRPLWLSLESQLGKAEVVTEVLKFAETGDIHGLESWTV